MGSVIVDVEESSVDDTTKDLEQELVAEEPHTQVDQELAEAKAEAAFDNLPEKLRGKSLEEVADMYTNLEKQYGRQGQEVGELRKLYDSFIEKTLTTTKQDTPTEPEETPDFFDDPERVVKSLIERELAPLKKEKEMTQQEQFKKKLNESFPDFEEITNSREFAEYVQASPYRIKMYADADNWNWDATQELLGGFKAYRAVQQNTATEQKDTQKTERAEKLKAATVEKSSTGETTRKVFRRADLVRLLQTDPERYYSMEPEIRKAYREGRVR